MRDVYERAVSNVPPANEKRYWQRYIYLWINYALFEELEADNHERTREVYRTCLKLMPHKIFTFAKVINLPQSRFLGSGCKWRLRILRKIHGAEIWAAGPIDISISPSSESLYRLVGFPLLPHLGALNLNDWSKVG